MEVIRLTTLFCVLFLSTTYVHAQDESNNATWKETIAFINKYSKHIEVNDFDYTTSVSISNNTLTIKGYNLLKPTDKELHAKIWSGKETTFEERHKPTAAQEVTLTIPLSELEDDSGFGISTLRSSIFVTSISSRANKTYKKYIGYILISVDDSEMRPRLRKAFEHLAYLATKKRKDKREALGEKF